MKHLLSCSVAAILAATGHAEIILPDIVGDNMVLQQQTEACIWGWSTPGSKITVIPEWDNTNYNAKADKDGFWELKMTTPEASYRPQSIEIQGDGSDILLKNILIGEVWFCSVRRLPHTSVLYRRDTDKHPYAVQLQAR